jgi:predicted ATP-dependent protease
MSEGKREGKIEDHLLKHAEKQVELQKKKKADLIAKEQGTRATLLMKQSDKYVVQRFVKEFEKVLAFIYTPEQSAFSTEETSQDEESKSQVGRIKEALTAPLNYLRFKEFLVEMCFMTEHQATFDTVENSLAFELWELIAPKINREIGEMSVDEEALDAAYITEMQAQ